MNIELDEIDYSSLNEEKVKNIVESAKQAQKERDEAKEAAIKERQAKENLTAELIEERKKKGEIKVDNEALKKTVDIILDEETIKSAVEKTLVEKEAKQKEDALQNFKGTFKNTVSDFSKESDPLGLKYQEFEKVLSMFNTTGISVEQAQNIYKTALSLYNGKDSKEGSSVNPYAFTPSSKSEPDSKGAGDTQLSKAEEDLIRRNGWTKERYLKVSKSHPGLINRLLN